MPIQNLRRKIPVVSFLLFFSLMARPAFAAGPSDRIARVNPETIAAVPGSVHPLARPEFDRGAVPESMPLPGLAIHFQRSATQQAALEALIAEQNDPSSPQFHTWLTPEQFATQFGMSAQDVATTSAWLASQGFSVIKVADSGNSILFSGTAGQVHHALGTEIHHFQVNGVTHYANASAVTLPSALASVVTSVSGLDDFHPVPKSIHSQVASPVAAGGGAAPLFTSGITGNHYLSPGDFDTIYDVKGLINNGFTGAGETIGIAGQTDVVLSDITAFRAAAGLSVNNPTIFLIPGSGDPGLSHSQLTEADLDLEWSGGVAPSANVVFLNSTDVFASLEYAIENRVPVNSSSVLIPILSISYGLCEANIGSVSTIEAAFQQAASQGQTIIAASGDDGAADCDNGASIATQGLAVDYPASSAYVTGVGGTEFNEGSTTGATTYWNGNVSGASSTDIISSAISYIPEMAWDDTPTTSQSEADGRLAAGGGGASILFTKPTWQTGVPGIPADGKRDVPDIALNASPAHDPYLMCTQVQLDSTGQYAGSCGNGFRIADGSNVDTSVLQVVGGTSAGAPSFAGVLALIEQKLGAPQGLVNKALYGIASNATTYASAFHDITVGSNAVPCSGGTGCSSGGVVGFQAGTGYDQATGLGSIDASNLATAYGNYVISNGGKVGTTVTLTPPGTPTIGQPVSFTATVTPNSGSGVPAGTVTFSVDGVAQVPAVTLVAGAATTNITFTTGGSHTVIAAYSGDSADYASISPTLTISTFNNAGGAATTTLTLTDGGVTTATLFSSSAPTFTATVTSASGTLAGSVTFTVGTGAAAVSTTVNVVGATGTGTATFTPATVTAATGFASPTTPVTAHYNGTTAYQQSTSNTLTLTVASPSFTITATAVTVSAAASAAATTANITVTSIGGFNDPVRLTLSSLNYPGCAFLFPTTVTPPANGTITTLLTIGNCSNASVTPFEIQPRGGTVSAGFGAGKTRLAREMGVLLGMLLCAMCFLLCSYREKKMMPRLVAMSMMVLLGGLLAGTTGCGGYGPTGGTNLPTGTYQITVTGTDRVNSQEPVVTTTFSVVVQ
jgi:subtilase family serine protease